MPDQNELQDTTDDEDKPKKRRPYTKKLPGTPQWGIKQPKQFISLRKKVDSDDLSQILFAGARDYAKLVLKDKNHTKSRYEDVEQLNNQDFYPPQTDFGVALDIFKDELK